MLGHRDIPAARLSENYMRSLPRPLSPSLAPEAVNHITRLHDNRLPAPIAGKMAAAIALRQVAFPVLVRRDSVA
jgi:hypothetical protein